MSKFRGFTLIELMIVVAVLGIISAIALPSYTRYVQKTHRSDALVMLTQAANYQERELTKNGTYTNVSTKLNSAGAQSENGFYQFKVLTDTTPAGTEVKASVGTVEILLSCGGAPCFQMAAIATGSQVNDSDCVIFTIDHLGRKRSYNSAGNKNAAGTCWG